ncbi:MAG: hypothetical protein JW891_06000 [Candidatus Lokiarchaeota archaeon]|nr:hypothetical protein [Candidatus Lokiarchaeota archaeon]
MSIQYYNTLQDKSQKRLAYLIDYIAPKLTQFELDTLLEDFNGKGKEEFLSFDKQKKDEANISKLKEDKLQLLYKVFISKELNNKIAVKWRFYQYLKYIRDFSVKSIQINKASKDKSVDLIVETQDKNTIFISCFEVLEKKDYDALIAGIVEFSKQKKIFPDRIIIAPNKTYRNIPIDITIKIEKKDLSPELWIELVDDRRPFAGVDLLMVDNTDLNIAGFNFTNLDDLLDYIYLNIEGGQVTVVKKPGFFSEYAHDESESEIMWKGIMLKKNI